MLLSDSSQLLTGVGRPPEFSPLNVLLKLFSLVPRNDNNS